MNKNSFKHIIENIHDKKLLVLLKQFISMHGKDISVFSVTILFLLSFRVNALEYKNKCYLWDMSKNWEDNKYKAIKNDAFCENWYSYVRDDSTNVGFIYRENSEFLINAPKPVCDVLPCDINQEANTFIKITSKDPSMLTYEERIEYIMEKYNLTYDELNVIISGILSEAKYNSYTDAYAVASVLYNRIHDSVWVSDTNRVMGWGCGTDLYSQVVRPNQFIDFNSRHYLNFVSSSIEDKLYLPNTLAIIDCFCFGSIHNYLQYRASSVDIEGAVTYVEGGNKFFSPMHWCVNEEDYKVRELGDL